MYLITCLIFLWGTFFSQKNISVQSANLNLSKSNINRVIYPSQLLSAGNAQLLVAELDKTEAMDESTMKTWLAANFKRFGIDSSRVKQITVYSGRKFSDCTVCKQNCKGRCVQDPGADCICMYHSEPNLRVAQPERPLTFIFLSGEIIDEKTALEMMSTTISSGRVTTVKSGKSNSSD